MPTNPPSSDLKIRRVTRDDGEVVKRLRLRSLAENPEAFASTYEREAAFADETWTERLAGNVQGTMSVAFLAFLEKEPVGIVVGARDSLDAREAFLYAMWTAPEARRCGVGRALVEAVVAWAAEGAELLKLGVTAGNKAALELYRTCGFEPSDDKLTAERGGARCELTLVRQLR